MEGGNMKFKFVKAGEDVEEKSLEEIFEEIRKYATDTGGFRIVTEKEIPKYIVIERASRPGPSYDYKAMEILISDGNLEFVSEKHIYNYPTQNSHLYKYKIANAQFVLILQWHGNDFQGGWQEWTTITIYGDCPFLKQLLKLREELSIP
jgi:hypothetical protein